MSHTPPPILSPPWSPRTKYTVALIMFLAASGFVLLLRDILFLIIASLVIAYLLNPVVTFLANRIFSYVFTAKSLRRLLAVMTTYIFVVSLFIVLILVVVPILVNQMEEFGNLLLQLGQSISGDIERWLSEPVTFNNEPVLINGGPFIPLEQLQLATGSDFQELIQFENFDLVGALQAFLGSVSGITGSAFNFLGSAVNVLVTGSFLLIMIFYLLRDGEIFVNVIIDSTPKSYRSDVRRLLVELSYVWNSYLRGQITLGLVIGIAVYLAALVLGVPNAPILGLLAGLLEFVPNLGPFLALIPAAFIALVSQSATIPVLEGVPFMIVVIIVWTTLQTLEAVYLVPRIMGTSLDLHPFVVIVAIIAGAAIAGALGVILAAPIVASSRILWLYFYGKLTDQNLLPTRTVIAAPSRQIPVPPLPGWMRNRMGSYLPNREAPVEERS